jgi:hypothetical protein
MNRLLKTILAAAIALPSLLPLAAAHAAATTQSFPALLCAPKPSVGSPGPRRVVNAWSTAQPQPSYSLNGAGCAVIANADIGYFLSQGYTYGPNEVALQQIAITANTTATTSTITLPAYAYIKYFILEETAGNAITGGVDIGDSASATAYQSAVALGANASVVALPTATKGIFSNSGVPSADQILVVCHTACNSGSINISAIVGFY